MAIKCSDAERLNYKVPIPCVAASYILPVLTFWGKLALGISVYVLRINNLSRA